jgi:carboxypeptidase PM20D1
MKRTLRLFAVRTALALALTFAVIVVVTLVRTISAGKPKVTAALQFSVPALDISAATNNLSTALRFETISYEDASNTQAFEGFRAWLVDTYPRFHATMLRTLVGEGTLIYEWKGTDASLQPIVLMAHQDVVPVPQPERWRHPPFSGAIVDGEIWGRGALDDKGCLIAIMEAAESLLAAGHAPARSVIFVFGHDEESLGKGARAAAELLAERRIKAAFVLDEGGLSLRDAPVTNGPMTLIGVAEKGYLTLQLEVKATGGHSNAPGTRTAIDTLASAIVAIRANPFPARYSGVTRDMLEAMAPHAPFMARMSIANSWLFEPLLLRQMSASPQGAATLHTTIAPTMLQGSPKQNVLPSVATAMINLRIMPGESIESVIAHVREAIGDLPVTVSKVGPSVEPSPIASTQSGGYRLVSGLAAKIFDAPVAPLLLIGATDSRHMTVLTDDIYRFSPYLLDLADAAIVHGFDERISVENLGRMLEFYQQVLVGGSAAVLPQAARGEGP